MQIIFTVRVTSEWANVKIVAKGYWSDKIQWGYEIFVSESVYMRIFKSDSRIVLRLWVKIFIVGVTENLKKKKKTDQELVFLEKHFNIFYLLKNFYHKRKLLLNFVEKLNNIPRVFWLVQFGTRKIQVFWVLYQCSFCCWIASLVICDMRNIRCFVWQRNL